MNLSVIVRNDLSSAAGLSGGLEEIKNPLNKRETTVYVNRHCMFAWWEKVRTLNGPLSSVWLCQRGPLTINFSLIKLITNSS